MGLDIWFMEDIRNALLAANEASSATAAVAAGQGSHILDLIVEELQAQLPPGPSQVLLHALHAAAVGHVDTLKHYRQGYRAALATVALAFGLAPIALGLLTQDQSETLSIEGRYKKT